MIPADHKWFLRTAVAAIIVDHLAEMNPSYPVPSEKQLADMQAELAELTRIAGDAGRRRAPSATAQP